jgi:phage gp45-like
MMRSSQEDGSRRAFLSLVRGFLRKASDKPKMQEHEVELLSGERLTELEYFHPYGFTSVPLPPDDKDGKKAAEVIVGFLSGNRSHGVVLAVSDRRHRPKDWKPGESGLHDHQGQRVHVTNAGIVIAGGTKKDNDDSSDKKLPITLQVGDAKRVLKKDEETITIGNATLTVKDGRIEAKVGDLKIIVTASRVDLGGEGGSAVITDAGPSSKVFAIL